MMRVQLGSESVGTHSFDVAEISGGSEHAWPAKHNTAQPKAPTPTPFH